MAAAASAPVVSVGLPPLTRELVQRALRQIDRAGTALPPSTVYELVYRGRRYPPRAVAEWAHRLATDDAAARWPYPAGTPTNAVLEALDFTISTKRPVLAPGHAADAAESADGLCKTFEPAWKQSEEGEWLGQRSWKALSKSQTWFFGVGTALAAWAWMMIGRLHYT